MITPESYRPNSNTMMIVLPMNNSQGGGEGFHNNEYKEIIVGQFKKSQFSSQISSVKHDNQSSKQQFFSDSITTTPQEFANIQQRFKIENTKSKMKKLAEMTTNMHKEVILSHQD